MGVWGHVQWYSGITPGPGLTLEDLMRCQGLNLVQPCVRHVQGKYPAYNFSGPQAKKSLGLLPSLSSHRWINKALVQVPSLKQGCAHP